MCNIFNIEIFNINILFWLINLKVNNNNINNICHLSEYKY